MVTRQGAKVTFHVYMLMSDRSTYTGLTDNLRARFWAHQDGRFRGYTYARRPVRLIFAEPLDTRDEAFAAERRIKGWIRKKKFALARSDWDELRRLARGRR